MRILITGVCGFAGSSLARSWVESGAGHALFGIDNFVRPGSETNRRALRRLGVVVMHGDVRARSDFDTLPAVDWVIDAAANPSVLAGIEGQTSSRQLVEHNLFGTVNTLEFCRKRRAGLILLSTSRVYSMAALSRIRLEVAGGAFRPAGDELVAGLSVRGISETFSTDPPLSLYGTSKLASEILALEYGAAFDFPVWINRCGVLAGGGQFGRADQGIFSFWIHSWARRRPLSYLGFGGTGHQVRDCLHPRDLLSVLDRQITAGSGNRPRVVNVSGGLASACSLRQCSEWCASRFAPLQVSEVPEKRPFDIPWLVLDDRLARDEWNWSPTMGREAIFEEIATHAEGNPNWLQLTDD
jgi:CDP-paratose 2-epimerase